MVIFHSYVKFPEGTIWSSNVENPRLMDDFPRKWFPEANFMAIHHHESLLTTNILSIINQYTIHYQPIYYPLSTNILSIINQYTIHYQPIYYPLSTNILSIINHYQPFLTRGYQPFSWPRRETIQMIPSIITGSMVTSLEFCTCKLMTCHGGTCCFWSPKRCRHVIYIDLSRF